MKCRYCGEPLRVASATAFTLALHQTLSGGVFCHFGRKLKDGKPDVRFHEPLTESEVVSTILNHYD